MSVNTGKYYRDKSEDKNKYVSDGGVPRLEYFYFYYSRRNCDTSVVK